MRTSPIRVTVFQPEDYVALVDGVILGQDKPVTLDAVKMGEQFAEHPSFSGWVGDTLIGCGGVMTFWPGYGRAWALLSPEAVKYTRDVHATVCKTLARIIRVHGFRRVEAVVQADFVPGRRWARHLGFREESVMPKYGQFGETFAMYVLFPEEFQRDRT